MSSVEIGALIACPRCHQPVTIATAENAVDCRQCHLRYPVVDQIPVMLLDQAQRLTEP